MKTLILLTIVLCISCSSDEGKPESIVEDQDFRELSRLPQIYQENTTSGTSEELKISNKTEIGFEQGGITFISFQVVEIVLLQFKMNTGPISGHGDSPTQYGYSTRIFEVKNPNHTIFFPSKKLLGNQHPQSIKVYVRYQKKIFSIDLY